VFWITVGIIVIQALVIYGLSSGAALVRGTGDLVSRDRLELAATISTIISGVVIVGGLIATLVRLLRRGRRV
jgi:hypothetical protein